MELQKNKIKMKIVNLLIIGLLAFVMISVFVSAFGVGFRGSKLNLHPGEVLDTSFSLQNNDVGTGTITIEAVVEEGGDYVAFVGESNKFNIPEGGNVEAPVRISIPENSRVGDLYKVKVLFRQLNSISGNEGGGTNVGFAFNQRNSFDIEVIEKAPVKGEQPPSASEEKTTAGSTAWIWVLVGIVIVVIIVWLILRKKK